MHSSFYFARSRPSLASFPTRRSSDLRGLGRLLHGSSLRCCLAHGLLGRHLVVVFFAVAMGVECPRGKLEKPAMCGLRHSRRMRRSEEHTSELQSREKLVCRLLLEKKK